MYRLTWRIVRARSVDNIFTVVRAAPYFELLSIISALKRTRFLSKNLDSFIVRTGHVSTVQAAFKVRVFVAAVAPRSG